MNKPMNKSARAMLLAGFLAFASFSLAQGPGNPLGGMPTGLSKKPGPSLAMGMGSDEINKGLGAPNTTPRSAGFTVSTVSSVPIANESVWEYKLKVNTPYSYNPRNGTWNADANLMSEIQVFRHIGFDQSGKAVIDVIRVKNEPGQGVEMVSAIRGLTENKGMLGGMQVSVDDPNGMRPGEVTSLSKATQYAAGQPTGGKGGGTPTPQGPGAPLGGINTGLSKPRRPGLALITGTGNGQPVILLGDAWDVNPVGALEPNLPPDLAPLLWSGATAPTTGGKGGTPSAQGSTVPGVDIIIKCMCGSVGSKGTKKCTCARGIPKAVVTNLKLIAVGAFDDRRLREQARAQMDSTKR